MGKPQQSPMVHVMSRANSKIISTRQAEPHRDLQVLVSKHLRHAWRRPVPSHTKDVFAQVLPQLRAARRLIYDSGCGTAESAFALGETHRDALVVGIDRSQARLHRHLGEDPFARVGNVVLIRAEIAAFWQLSAREGLCLSRHCLFYPNPWPKPQHLNRRWHSHPVFPTLLALGGEVELRTNWEIYAREFAAALQMAGIPATLETLAVNQPISAFERKYLASQHGLWAVRAALSASRDFLLQYQR